MSCVRRLVYLRELGLARYNFQHFKISGHSSTYSISLSEPAFGKYHFSVYSEHFRHLQSRPPTCNVTSGDFAGFPSRGSHVFLFRFDAESILHIGSVARFQSACNRVHRAA